MTRYERPSVGDLVDFSYEGPYGGHGGGRAVVESVNGDVVELKDGWTLDLGKGRSTSLGGRELDLYSVGVTVPASQVRNPHVHRGDVVMFKTGSQTHRVERVEDGVVHTHDGWSRPVTHVTAFDEDTGRHDPFSIPDGYEGLYGR